MMKRLIAILMMVFFANSAAAQAQIVNAPSDGFLNLRTGPGGQYSVVMEMDHGTRVQTLEIAGKWARVRHQSGVEGWAFRKYMVTGNRGPEMMFVHSPGDGFLNLRTGPGSGYAIFTRMQHGAGVRILERVGGWARVRYHHDYEGWAYLKYLRK